MARLSPFPYYGGKHYSVKWILPLLPKCQHYVEPFCGAGYIALNREPSPVETINDLNGDLINFFVQLRDNAEQLIDGIELTLYSRNELTLAREPCDDNLERARRFLVRVVQGYSGNLNSTGWSSNVNTPQAKGVARWFNRIPKLPAIVSRLKQMQIESKPALEIIKRYDTGNTLFYCDPPYLQSTRSSKTDYVDYEMSDDGHRQLASALRGCKGKVAISGYRSDLYDELYQGWHRHDKETTSRTTTARAETKPKRVESLWTNYEVPNAS